MADRYWVGGTAIWDATAGTKWSATSGGAGGASVPTSADNVFFDQASTYTVTMTGALACLNLTVSAGTVTFAQGTTPTLTVAGNWSTIAGTVWSMTGAVTFTATTAKTITSGGITNNSPWTFNGTGGSWTLQDNLTFASTITTTLTAGTLALGTFTLTTGLFSSASAVARTINFGTGKIVLISATTSTVWNTSTITNLTISGTSLVECQGGGTAVTKTISAGALSEANAISFSLLETTGTATYAFTAGNTVKNLITNGVQTVSNIAITIYGAFTHQTTNGTTTFTAGVNAWTFAATSGSYSITNIAGFTYGFPWTFGSATSTATWTLAANLTITGALTLTNGTLDVNNKTVTPSTGITILTGSATLNNTGGTTLSTTTVTHTSGTLTLGTNLTATTSYTLTAGTLSLVTFTLTTATFSSANANARTLAFGTGKIVISSTATSTVWNTGTVTNLTVTGTSLVEFQGGAAALATKTINTGTLTEAQAMNFSLLDSSTNVTYAFTAANAVKNLIVNGIQTVSNIAITIYGNFTHSTASGTTTFTAGTNAWTFGATSGTYSLGHLAASTYDWPWTFGALSSTATWSLANNLTLGATRQLTLVTGTFDFNSKTFSGAGITISNSAGTFTLANTGTASFSTTVPITHAVGTFTLPFDVTTSSASGFTFFTGTNTGTLNLNNFILTTRTFTTAATTGAKTLAFGTGKIVLNGTATATVFNISTAVANVTVTGTPLVECQGGGTAVTKTINTGVATQANAISFSLLETTGTVTYAFTAANTVKNLITNGVQTLSNIAIVIYGTFTHQTTNGTTTFTAGTNAWTFAATSGSYSIDNITPFTYDFPWTFGSATSTATWTLSNNLTLGATRQLTLTNGTFDMNNKTISAAGFTIATGTPTLSNTGGSSPFTTALPFTHTSGSFTLPFDITITSATGYTFTAGTLALSTFTLTTRIFSSANANTRTLNFGTGKIVLNGSVTATIWNTSTITGLTVSGTPLVECIGGGTAVTKTISPGALSEANSISFSLLETTGTVTYTITTATSNVRNLIVNGVQTLTNSNIGIFGTFTHSTTNGTTTFSAGTNAWIFAATSGSYSIGNIAGFTYDFPWTFGSAASTATWSLSNNLTLGATRQLTLTNGILDVNNKTVSAAGITVVTGSATLNNTDGTTLSITGAITHTSGTLTLGTNLTTTAATGYTLTAGTLNLVTFTLTTPVFVSNNANVRTLNYGTGQLTLTGNAATIFNITTATNFTSSGTVDINCTYTGATGTRTIVTGFSITQAAGYNVSTSGTTGIVLSPSATDTVALTGSFFSIDLTSFTGTLSNTARTIYGSLTLPSSGGTFTAGTLTTTFGSTTSQTITSNGRTLDFPITFNGVGGSWALQDSFTSGSTRTTTLTSGTLNLNNFTFTTGLFSSSGAVARTLAFSTSGQLALIGTGTIFDTTTATSFATTGTVYINAATSSGTKTIVTGFTEAQSVGYDVATSGTAGVIINTADTITLTGSFEDINLTGFAGTLTNTARTVYGSWTNPSTGGTYTAGTLATTFASTSSKTITSNGRTLDFPITFNGVGGSWALQSNFAAGSTRLTTLTGGTLNLNDFTFSTGLFNSSGAVSRTLAFGTSGQLSLVSTGATAIFDVTTATNFATTGTPYINCLNVSSTARTIVTGFTEAQASAGYSLAFSGTTGFVLNNLAGETLTLTGGFYNFNLTSFTGTLANTARTVYGSWTNPSTGGTYTAGANATTFASTTSQTITGNGRTIDFPIIFNGVGGSWALQTAFTTGSARSTTLTAGTLNLNNYNYTTQLFSSSGSGVRTLAFSTSGQLVLVGGNAVTIFDVTTATNYSTTGTVYINCTYALATGTRTIVTGFTEAQAVGYDVSTSGTSGIVLTSAIDTIALTGNFEDINLTGFAGTLANTARTVYGNWTTPTSGGTYTAGANATSFRSTSSKTITSNGRTLDFPLTFDGVGGTWTLQDNLTIGATRVLTWNNGTLDLNNFTLSTPASITINGGATGLFTLKNTGGTQSYTTSVAVTHTTGELNLFFNMTFGAYTWSAGRITLNSYTLTCTTWASTSTTARTFAFGTGNLTVTGSGAALFNMTGATSVTVTGTPNVNITNSTTTASTVAPGSLPEASCFNFNFSNGIANYVLTFLGTAGQTCRDVTFGNFGGTWAAVASCTIYGSFSGGQYVTYTASANTITFGGTGLFGNKSIGIFYPNYLPFNVNFNGIGSYWATGSDFNCDATHSMTFTNGTIDGTSLFKVPAIPQGGMSASSMTMTTGTFTFINVVVSSSFTHTSGTLNLQGSDPFMLLGTTIATSTYTFTAGTINLSTDMYVGVFSSANLNTRTLAFGTSKIYINAYAFTTGATTVWNTAGSLGATTGWTTTGTPDIRVETGSATAYALTVAPGIMTEAQSLSFTFTGSGNLSFLNTASYTARTVDLGSYTGTWTATSTCTIYGSFTAGGTLTESASVMTFGGTTVGSFNSTKTINGNGSSIKFPMTFNGTASTWTFTGDLTMGATVARALIAVNGTLDVATYAINLGFAGSTMSVNTGTVIINNATNVNLPFTLTSGTCTFGGASGCVFNSTFTFTAGTMTLSAAVGIIGAFTYTAGTLNLSGYGLTLYTSYVASGATTRVLNFGSGGYIKVQYGVNYDGSGGGGSTLTLWNTSTPGTFSYTGTSDIRIEAWTSSTIVVNTGAMTEAQSLNFRFIDNPAMYLNASGCVFKNLYFDVYQDVAWTAGATTIYGSLGQTFPSATGVPSASASTITFAGASGTKTIFTSATFQQPVVFNGAASIWQFQNDFNSTNTITLTAGTLQLSGYSIIANIFSASGSTARTIDFATSTPGSGSAIVVKGNGTPFTTATATNLTLSGTYPLVKVMPSAPTGTLIVAGSGTEAQSFSYYFYNGDNAATYTLNFLGTAGYAAKDVDFSGGFTGTWAAISTGTVYGSLSLYGGTITASASALTFGGTSGTKTIQTNGISIPFPITFNGAGSTFQLSNALTLSTTALTTTHTNGILDLNGYTLTTGIYTTAAGTKNITFDGGTLVVSGSGATAFNNAQPTNFTTTAGTGTGTISMTSATAKTFVGAGSTYNCTLSQDGSGALTISGSNTFGNMANGVSPATITFTAGTTQTVSNWTVNGTSGNLITLNSSTSGTLANISKTDGGYMNYVSLKDLAFQPCSTNGSGALPNLWYGGADSTHLGNIFGIVLQTYSPGTVLRTYTITSTSITSWSVPADFNPYNNIIHLIGGGGGGAGNRETNTSNRAAGGGGGGGGYTKLINYQPGGATVTVAVGAGGTAGTGGGGQGGAGGTTTFGSDTAGGGGGGTTTTTPSAPGGAGGVGSTYNGGKGGNGGATTANLADTGSGGGGGAGGPNGVGGAGGNGFSGFGTSAGGGGGGNGNGTAGTNAAASTFGPGGNGYLATGGGSTSGAAGTPGTGGGGAGSFGANSTGGAGAFGRDILNTWGGAGGSGGSARGGAGVSNTLGYGGGGSGGTETNGSPVTSQPGGSGGSGIIIIQYYVSTYSTGSFFAFF